MKNWTLAHIQKFRHTIRALEQEHVVLLFFHLVFISSGNFIHENEIIITKCFTLSSPICIFFPFPPSQVFSNWWPYLSAVHVHFNSVSPGQGMVLDSFTQPDLSDETRSGKWLTISVYRVGFPQSLEYISASA